MTSLRVATFNIRHGAPARGRADVWATAAVVTSFGADVVALQEVDVRTARSGFADQAVRVARAARLHPTFGPALSRGPFGSYGNALLTAAPPQRVSVVDLPASREPRAAVIVEIEVRGRRLTVAGTHLQNARPAEARAQLAELLRTLRGWPSPRVLLGDLNLEPAGVVPLLRDAGYAHAEAPPTFPAHRPRQRIDWIAAHGAAVVSAWVPDVLVSDHRPLVAELQVL